MKTTHLVIYSMASSANSLNLALSTINESFPGQLTVTIRGRDELENDAVLEAYLTAVRKADLLMIMTYGGRASIPVWDQLQEAAQNTDVYWHPSDRDEDATSSGISTDYGSDFFLDTARYIRFGGVENWTHLFKRILQRYGGQQSLEIKPPRPQPCQALYHPETGAVDTLEDYLRQRGVSVEDLANGSRTALGIWFYPHYYIESNLEAIDALVKEVEHQGLVPICVFSRRFPDPEQDMKGNRWVIENYFKHHGRNVIHALINTTGHSVRQADAKNADIYKILDVPVIQALPLSVDREFWTNTYQAVSPMDISAHAAQPEFDGVLISVPFSTRELAGEHPLTGLPVIRQRPIAERIAKIVRLTRNWARLSQKPNHEKKVAIIFHNYPPRNDRIGCAFGLDSFASVADMVKRLKDEGYGVETTWDDPQDLADRMLGSLTADRRWLMADAMAERAADSADRPWHAAWHAELPETVKAAQIKDWGDPPGDLFVFDDQILINGIINQNVYIGIQPPRGFMEQPEKIHDPLLPPTHHYLCFYRWIRDVFKADAVIHVGKHGSLEWLPGKTVGLGPECYPDLAIMELPNLYPYIINNPGEGTQAKRRSYCCIDSHLIPVMTNADLYEDLAEIDNLVLSYVQTQTLNPTRLPVMQEELWSAAEKADLDKDLGITRDEAFADFDAFMEKLHDYLSQCADTAIADGLHTLGQPPQGEMLVELATQMVRINNGSTPSLREALCAHWGYDYDKMLDNRGRADHTRRYTTYAEAIRGIHDACREVVRKTAGSQRHELARENRDIQAVDAFLKDTVLPKIQQTGEEMETIVRGLSGEHIPPGGSGSPTRGQVDVLPSGRNFYSVDPYKVPSPGAWRIGKNLARDLVARHREETGSAPDTMGMVLWASPTMRNQGEDVAEALYLMGMEPVWNEASGRIEDLKVIPLKDMDFPRVDITFRTSGLFRDTFPNLCELLDKAACIVAALDEPIESNMLRKNVVAEVADFEKKGLDPKEAFRKATFRVFSDMPGAYGAGVDKSIDAKMWETSDDLGETYVEWGGYAYGRKTYGDDMRETFRSRLKKIGLVVQNVDSREHDILACVDYNAYMGGFTAAVKMASGVQPVTISGDGSDPERIKSRTIAEEAKHVFRSRILNPKWIEGLKRHGYKGAGDLSRTIDISFHWDATTQIIDDWMYERLADRYAFDADMREWFKNVNPYALQNITERLLEAISRGMWDADQETKDKLEEIYLEIEGEIEEVTA